MHDQAAGLRRLLGQAPDLQAVGLFGADAVLTARTAAALADGLARRGAHLWLLDEPPPPSNAATQFGLHPPPALEQLAAGLSDPGDELPGSDGAARVLALAGGTRALARLDESAWPTLAAGLEALPNRPEWLLIHADSSGGAPSIALMAETRILITQARKSALTDAYGLLKQAEQSRPARQWLVLLVNVSDPQAAQRAFDGLADTARRFLGARLQWLGLVPQDNHLESAARRMRPLLEYAPRSAAAAAFRALAGEVLGQMGEKTFQWHDFWQKMWLFSRSTVHMPRPPAPLPRSEHPAW